VLGGGHPLPVCAYPLPHSLLPIAVQGLELLGRVAHPAIGAPAPDDRVEFGHDGRQGVLETSACRLLPHMAPEGLPRFRTGPHQWHQFPRPACSAFVNVEPQTRKPRALHLDATRLGGLHWQLEVLQDRGDGRQGVRSGATRATDDQPIVRIARQGSQRAILLGPLQV